MELDVLPSWLNTLINFVSAILLCHLVLYPWSNFPLPSAVLLMSPSMSLCKCCSSPMWGIFLPSRGPSPKRERKVKRKKKLLDIWCLWNSIVRSDKIYNYELLWFCYRLCFWWKNQASYTASDCFLLWTAGNIISKWRLLFLSAGRLLLLGAKGFVWSHLWLHVSTQCPMSSGLEVQQMILIWFDHLQIFLCNWA